MHKARLIAIARLFDWHYQVTPAGYVWCHDDQVMLDDDEFLVHLEALIKESIAQSERMREEISNEITHRLYATESTD